MIQMNTFINPLKCQSLSITPKLKRNRDVGRQLEDD